MGVAAVCAPFTSREGEALRSRVETGGSSAGSNTALSASAGAVNRVPRQVPDRRGGTLPATDERLNPGVI